MLNREFLTLVIASLIGTCLAIFVMRILKAKGWMGAAASTAAQPITDLTGQAQGF